MKKSKLCPELTTAKSLLIREINIFLSSGAGSTLDAIHIIVPVIAVSMHLDYRITENARDNEYGCKVELSTSNQKLTIKF